MKQKLLNLFKPINSIKHIERKGWVVKGVMGVRDTIASHSLGAASLGWFLSEIEGVNSDRVIKMLLIHDFIMAYIDDLTPADGSYGDKEEIERKSLEKLMKNVPPQIAKEFSELICEYQEQKTKESIVAREADELDTLLQARIYSKQSNKDILSEFLNTYQKYFKTATGKHFWRELHGENQNMKYSQD